ncbi:MAG: PEP-CTERM sorting domain-containing protein [Sphingomonadales bacterium]|nr:PEP-CTERM sorting domain-containing protein [Sphingomonadales bacterium]MBK6490477.1 PEP-CTERM sorting domain-containing protein [Sphingomonadales bacterium]MBK6719566.1 PEP-CTERM sorting domain-containing protein [Sphingomonadales bacterium]MBK8273069.1 PEP-CTERM sorting domain-containing protein [Sphingomonadales bacterium]MBK8859617.1 PEP-CTERM sorting domain-containing protein [Sphingomonadales bacterium]
MRATSVNISVPEPATWALLILGFGGIGIAMRRRNFRATFAIN